MYFPPEDAWMDPDIHIRRLVSIERDLIRHLEKLQDPSVIVEFQKRLNKLAITKMEWIKIKEKMELIYSGL